MKAGWEVKPLKDLCDNFKQDIVDGPFGANLKREHYTTEGTPVLKIQNIKPFQIVLKKMDFVDEQKAKELSRHSYTRNDIIITKLGQPLGISAIVDDIDDGIIVADLVRVRAARVDTKFLCYQLNSPLVSEHLNSLQKGTTRPRVQISAVRELPIACPPLGEQKRIVAVLDAAFEGLTRARTHIETNLQNARELFESFANSTVEAASSEYPARSFSELARNLDRQRVPITKGDRVAGGIPYYGASGVVDHVAEHLFDEDLLLISEDGANLLARTYPIAFSVSGKCWVNNHAHILRFDEPAQQAFAELFLNSISLEPYVSGMAQPKLNQQSLNRIPVPMPPSDKCGELVSKAAELKAQVGNLQTHYRTKLQDLDDLRQSLLQKAFAGELT